MPFNCSGARFNAAQAGGGGDAAPGSYEYNYSLASEIDKKIVSRTGVFGSTSKRFPAWSLDSTAEQGEGGGRCCCPSSPSRRWRRRPPQQSVRPDLRARVFPQARQRRRRPPRLLPEPRRQPERSLRPRLRHPRPSPLQGPSRPRLLLPRRRRRSSAAASAVHERQQQAKVRRNGSLLLRIWRRPLRRQDRVDARRSSPRGLQPRHVVEGP